MHNIHICTKWLAIINMMIVERGGEENKNKE
jgi:hypothetical protein